MKHTWGQNYRHSANVSLCYHAGLFYNHGTVSLLLYTSALVLIILSYLWRLCLIFYPTCYKGLRSLAITFMTNPQVPYSLILIGLCEWMFWVETVKGLRHLLKCRFACNSITKGWKLGWNLKLLYICIWRMRTSSCKKLQHNTVQRISKEDLLTLFFFGGVQIT